MVGSGRRVGHDFRRLIAVGDLVGPRLHRHFDHRRHRLDAGDVDLLQLFDEAEDRVEVGLQGFEDRTIGTLSGGQMQRALFARLLLQDARLFLLDEPFASLDAGTVADLLEIIRRWQAGA